ncbi:MAG: ABC transporter permease [Devosia sp.]|uniref:ABC transporter permease n=1 Tax=Devosia sp. TaxID=1871048 RepID=UPI001ACDCA13|nr:ABC transporter permease [Devosia sp.]MBN9311269.1 ABC transporter permease [Devosia sp.]MBN9315592.1 ABC transporter permease [Devosia sp.]
MSSDIVIAILMTMAGAATPILLAALGELVVEKSGVLNLGVEGMMLVGAVITVAVTLTTGNHLLAVACAAAAAALAALIFGVLTLTLSANQVATGLALTILGTGFSALFGRPYTGKSVPTVGSPFPAELATDPVWRLLFGHSVFVYLALIMVVAVWWFLQRTRSGLILRAVGENDLSAHSMGYSVIGVRYAAVAFGGAMAGIAGACFPLALTPQWVERLTTGKGWIALALVVFAAWRPFRLAAGAYFFGLMMIFEVYAKSSSSFRVLPSEFWAALPYLATVVVLVLISLRREGSSSAPACLGKPFIAAG